MRIGTQETSYVKIMSSYAALSETQSTSLGGIFQINVQICENLSKILLKCDDYTPTKEPFKFALVWRMWPLCDRKPYTFRHAVTCIWIWTKHIVWRIKRACPNVQESFNEAINRAVMRLLGRTTNGIAHEEMVAIY